MITDVLVQGGIRFVSYEDWERLDKEEQRRGESAGKIREKFISVDDMLAFLDGHSG